MARKTGSRSLDTKLDNAEFGNSYQIQAREARQKQLLGNIGKPLKEGVRGSDRGFFEAFVSGSAGLARRENPLRGVVTDRRGSVEIPGASVPGIEKKARLKKPSRSKA